MSCELSILFLAKVVKSPFNLISLIPKPNCVSTCWHSENNSLRMKRRNKRKRHERYEYMMEDTPKNVLGPTAQKHFYYTF